ncbi:MAG: GNAT family N-acetyltransferase [Planctomycetaceae bacterium]|nr:GNAT family N-acetyltransferase [Planctomycetaceae bacterium]
MSKITTSISVRLERCSPKEYERFRQYHYLPEPLHTAAECYLIVMGKCEVGFIGILPQATRGFHRSKRISRLVVLPNYEGLGIGRRILNAMGRYFDRQGFALRICTQSADMFRLLRRAR